MRKNYPYFCLLLGLFAITVATQDIFPETPTIFAGGSLIHDANYNQNEVERQIQAEKWTYSTPRESRISKCTEAVRFFGGPNIFGGKDSMSRTYKDLPKHSYFSLSVEVLAFDLWSKDDYFTLSIDGVSFGKWTPGNGTRVVETGCGINDAPDTWGTFLVQAPHSGSSMTVNISLFISSTTVDKASLGFQELIILLSNTEIPSTVPEVSYCSRGICKENNDGVVPSKTSGTRQCAVGEVWNGVACVQCDATCGNCHTSGVSHCNTCKGNIPTDSPHSFQSLTSKCLLNSKANCRYQNLNDYNSPCEMCKQNYILRTDGTCMDKSQACPSGQKLKGDTILKCIPKCATGQAMLWNGTCIDASKCYTPLLITSELGSSESNCQYPVVGNCRRGIGFLTLEGQCVVECPTGSYSRRDPTGYGFCDRCKTGQFYHELNKTCIPTCPKFMIIETVNEYTQRCKSACPLGQYMLSNNGSCIPFSSCVEPFKVREQIWCDTPLETALKINGETIILKQEDRWSHVDDQNIKINEKDYMIDVTWATFALDQKHPIYYDIHNYKSEVNCGCHKQECGRDCAAGVYCNANEGARRGTCMPSDILDNFCWNIYSVGHYTYRAYNLSLVSIFSLFDYGGPAYQLPDVKPFYPGFAVNNKVGEQHYALNAYIVDYILDPVAQDIIYSESERRVIKLEDLKVFQLPPEITVDLNNAKCDYDNQTLHRTILPHTVPAKDYLKFFKILNTHKSGQEITKTSLTNLKTYKLLTPHGYLHEWWNLKNMTILDPCNHLFLNLEMDPSGVYFAKVPQMQTLLDGDIICIAINLNTDDERDLTLFELKNGTSIWSRSDRFVGLLSNDYIDRVKLRLTTSGVVPSNNGHISLEINDNIEPPKLIIKSNVSIESCEVYVGTDCLFKDISLKGPFFYYSTSLIDCGNFYERAFYSCDGIQGYFYPPAKIVETPISHWSFTEYDPVEHEESLRRINTPMHQEVSNPWTWYHWWRQFFTDWSTPARKIFKSLLFSSISLILFFGIRSRLKQRKLEKQDQENVVLTEEANFNTENDEKEDNQSYTSEVKREVVALKKLYGIV